MNYPLAFAVAFLAASGLARAATFPPEAVRLGGDSLAVEFPNGVTCRATVPLTGAGEGGFDAGCPQPMRWALTITKRNYLEPIFGAAVSPYARVVISDGSGRAWVFRTPPYKDKDRDR